MSRISERARNAAPSPTLAITAKCKALQAQGVDIVGFGAGEPDFDTPDHIKAAAIEALNSGQTKYTASSGTPLGRSTASTTCSRRSSIRATR
jgi:aspartate aminotransferase